MATSHSKQTSAQREEAPSRAGIREAAVRADPRGAGLWWLWLLSDQATIGTGRRARTEPVSPADPRPTADPARSWALADLALEST